ncbi:MAG TPA: hypothetical protein VGP05_16395 [Pseudonocardia sp.]|nr:hypothetical protein [Pseudonocardia sp.]
MTAAVPGNDSYADITEQMFREFASEHSLSVIADTVRRCRTDLRASRHGSGLESLERLVRQRLSATVRPRRVPVAIPVPRGR